MMQAFIISHNHNNCLKDSQWTLKCTFGHEFLTSGNHIQKIKNCPDTTSHPFKKNMHKLIEHHFQAEFPNIRPDWYQLHWSIHLSLTCLMKNQPWPLNIMALNTFCAFLDKNALKKSLRNDSERHKSCGDNGIKLVEIHMLKAIKILQKIY